MESGNSSNFSEEKTIYGFNTPEKSIDLNNQNMQLVSKHFPFSFEMMMKKEGLTLEEACDYKNIAVQPGVFKLNETLQCTIEQDKENVNCLYEDSRTGEMFGITQNSSGEGVFWSFYFNREILLDNENKLLELLCEQLGVFDCRQEYHENLLGYIYMEKKRV